jgi:hypothetical protein
MLPFLIILAVVGGLLVIACIVAFIARRLHPDGYDASPQQVCVELQRILEGRDKYAFDDFTSIGPLKDPRLEAIRQRCARLPDEFPPEAKGELFGAGGIEVIRGFIRELGDEMT